MARNNGSWFSGILSAFATLFGIKREAQTNRSAIQTSSKSRRVAGHWPVWIELSKTTAEQFPPHDDSAFTLRFSLSDSALLKSVGIKKRDFDGSYVPEKKAMLVQVPERLVEEIMNRQEPAVYVEGFLDGASLGSRKFTIPLRF